MFQNCVRRALALDVLGRRSRRVPCKLFFPLGRHACPNGWAKHLSPSGWGRSIASEALAVMATKCSLSSQSTGWDRASTGGPCQAAARGQSTRSRSVAVNTDPCLAFLCFGGGNSGAVTLPRNFHSNRTLLAAWLCSRTAPLPRTLHRASSPAQRHRFPEEGADDHAHTHPAIAAASLACCTHRSLLSPRAPPTTRTKIPHHVGPPGRSPHGPCEPAARPPVARQCPAHRRRAAAERGMGRPETRGPPHGPVRAD